MRVEVESTRCQGHTLCAMIAPKSFVLDDVDGHAHTAGAEVPQDEHDQVLEAARSCPEQAIRVLPHDGAPR
ncbi:ferredoxin [Mycolicibacterium austroafricanum]|uniref:Ferredoxin n=1 Tax=Mycolicibacterium austroafricanum TaxID=39687 RepID=A0ABT8HFE8_MYCAO|nr:ferredoxin [Mycolicibacterium austroafricanum]MDN4519492.1 ferredoxin [Mycolicibacterium austroafricanum]